MSALLETPDFCPTTLARDHARLDRRAQVQELVSRAAHLPPDERRLVEMTRGDGRSVRRVAAALGHCPRALQRRLKRIVERLNDPAFEFLVNHSHLLPPPLQTVGDFLVIRGCTMHETARLTRQSLHTVRQQLTALRALASAGKHI